MSKEKRNSYEFNSWFFNYAKTPLIPYYMLTAILYDMGFWFRTNSTADQLAPRQLAANFFGSLLRPHVFLTNLIGFIIMTVPATLLFAGWAVASLIHDPISLVVAGASKAFNFIKNCFTANQQETKNESDKLVNEKKPEFEGLFYKKHVIGSSRQVFELITPWQHRGKNENVAEHVKNHLNEVLPDWTITPQTKFNKSKRVVVSHGFNSDLETINHDYQGSLLEFKYKGNDKYNSNQNRPDEKLNQLGIKSDPWYMHAFFKPFRLLCMTAPSLMNRHKFDHCEATKAASLNH